MNSIDDLTRKVAQLLTARGEWLSCAESCTGGLISAALTEVAGSSAWFGYGFVTYSNEAKQRLLGVEAATLAQYGAVSERTVREMALGALARAGADWSLAVSGIAGPGGGSVERPVGMVWFSLATKNGECEAFVRQFSGDRASVRQQTVQTVLERLVYLLEGSSLTA